MPLLQPFLLCLLLDPAAAAPPPPRGYLCERAKAPIVVDGKLDDPSWADAAWTEDFVDIEGDVRPRPKHRTRAKMLWDDKHFYIAADLEEPNVWATLTAHDSVIFRDNDFEVFIDPDGDNHEYYELEINALNTEWDLFLPRPYRASGSARDAWEIPGLKKAIHVDGTLNDPTDKDRGWSVELAIPWAVLGEFAHRPTPPNVGDRWRVNFSRVEWEVKVDGKQLHKVEGKAEDNWVWSPQGVIDMHRPERWGFVQFNDRAKGTGTLKPLEDWAARDLLSRIFQTQCDFQKKHERWARSLEELGLPLPKEAEKSLVFQPEAEGFTAKIVVQDGDARRTWTIRQDSKLTVEPPLP